MNLPSNVKICGHRGFKGRYAENTLSSFEKSFNVGATVIETDVWLTRDNVVVISHDGSTKRVFCDQDGQETDTVITGSRFEEIEEFRTISSGEKLMKFSDVLQWFVGYVESHSSSHHKIMLDIKRTNPPKLVKFIIENLLAVKDDIVWWIPRIQLGVWDLTLLKYLNQDSYFQQVFKQTRTHEIEYRQFDIIHISTNWRDSLHYIDYNNYIDRVTGNKLKFRVTGISLIYLLTWSSTFVARFIPLMNQHNLKLYSWTVNTTSQFDYLLSLSRVAGLPEYGIISDFPDTMVEHLAKEYDLEHGLDSEITKVPSANNKVDCVPHVHISWSMRFFYYIYKTFMFITAVKRVTEEELQFDSFVDEDRIPAFNISSFALWIFSTCQKYGLF